MGVEWTFRSYVNQQGKVLIREWYSGQSDAVQGTFDNRLKHLRVTKPQNWRRPLVEKLSGKCDGLVEIRFKADNVQHRPLGFYGPNSLEFTIVYFATEKGGKFIPKEACEIALERKKEVLADINKRSCVYEVEQAISE